jgi:cytoskeletal protein RodZ
MATSVNLDISQQLDITCRRGDTFLLSLNFTQADGITPLDVSSERYKFNMDVRESDTDDGATSVASTDSSAIATGSANINVAQTNGENGQITLTITADAMATIVGGSYVYDLQAEQQSNGATTKIETWLFGSFIVNEDVTINA